MTDIMTWLDAHGASLLALLLTAHVAAVVIVNLTPTPKDDEALARIYPWIEKLAGIITSKAKE